MEQEELAANKNKLIAEDFQFDDGDGFRGTSGSSWDFTSKLLVHALDLLVLNFLFTL